MGFYVRKSLKAGPFRFNLSKSGVGISSGVPGFRVGSGPRGNYVRMGRGGIYYRSSLNSNSPRRQSGIGPSQPAFNEQVDDVLLEDVTGTTATELVSTGPDDLVNQLNEAKGRARIAPWIIGLLALFVVAAPPVGIVLLLPGIPVAIWLSMRDKARRSVVVFYQVEDNSANWFTELIATFDQVASLQGKWRINAEGDIKTTNQYKTHSGAKSLVKQADITVKNEAPRFLVTNIAVPTLICGKQSLHFLPDRLLVEDAKKFSDVSYSDLKASAAPQRFIESGRVPSDSTQVGSTWQFVNVKGGPDRRYRNNRQLPIMQYGKLDLSSSGGLHWTMQLSAPAVADHCVSIIEKAPKTAIHGEIEKGGSLKRPRPALS